MSSVEAPEGRTVNSLTIILVKCAPEGRPLWGGAFFCIIFLLTAGPSGAGNRQLIFYLSLKETVQ